MLCAVGSLPADKPQIVAYAAMMAIQNFGFFLMYWMIYLGMPAVNSILEGATPVTDNCDDLRFWTGFFALDCFIESFCCIWMAMGGYIDSKCMFTFGWILHLVVALPYCISTLGIPAAIYADEGELCREGMGNKGHPLVAAFWTHAFLFVVYVWMMLSITYFSFLKPSFFKNSANVQD